MANGIERNDGREWLQKMQMAGMSNQEIENVMRHQNIEFFKQGHTIEETADYWGLALPDEKPVRSYWDHEIETRTTPQDGEEPRAATGIVDSVFAGLQVSASGLALTQDLPTVAVPEDAGVAMRVASGLATIAGDLPFMAIGGMAGLLAGSPTGPGAAVTSAAGAFALPEALRTLMMEMYAREEISNVHEFMQIVGHTFEAAGKSALIGAATGGVGRIARVAGPAIQIPAEVVTMTKVSAALEGREATAQEYIDGALMVAGLRATPAAVKATKSTAAKLRGIYAKTGMRPRDVIEQSRRNPSIVEDTLSSNHDVPRVYEDLRSTPRQFTPPERQPGKKKTFDDPNEEHIHSRIVFEHKETKNTRSISDIYTAVVNRLNPIEKAVKAMAEGKELPFLEDAAKQAQAEAGAIGKANHMIDWGAIDFKTGRIVAVAPRQFLKGLGDDAQQFSRYLIARRAVELSRQERKIETGIDAEAAAAFVAKHDGKYGERAGLLGKYQDAILDYAKDAGLLSEKDVTAMRELGKDYVPLRREIEEASAGGGKGFASSLLALKGSELKIIDPLESVLENTYALVRAAERNAVRRTFVEQIEKTGRSEFGTRVRKKRGGAKRRSGEIEVVRDGKWEFWNVGEDVAESFAAMDSFTASLAVKYLSKPARLTRAGAVFAPAFLVKNFIRDQFSAFIFSENGYRPFVVAMYGASHIFNQTKIYQDWVRSGGQMASVVAMDRAYLQYDVKQMTGQGGFYTRHRNLIRNPLEVFRLSAELVENATRVGEFRRALKKVEKTGREVTQEDVLAAGFASREVTLDFARIGMHTRQLNMIAAFFNANLQGTDKVFRELKNNPVRTLGKSAMTISLFSGINWYLNHDKEWWSEVPDYVRDLFWVTEINGHVYRIPKPHELGLLMGSTFERFLDYAQEQNPETAKEIGLSIYNTVMPGMVPNAVLPFIEAYSNKNMLTDAPLIPHSREQWVSQFQYKEGTHELTRKIGEALAELPWMRQSKFASPPVIENTYRAWTGSLGMLVLDAADKLIEETGMKAPAPRRNDTLEDLPVMRAFMVKYPTAGSKSINQFFERNKEVSAFVRTVRGLAREGEAEQALLAAELSEGKLVSLDHIATAISRLSRSARIIDKAPNIDGDEKNTQIDAIRFAQIEQAKAGLAIIDALEESLKRVDVSPRRRRTAPAISSTIPIVPSPQSQPVGTPEVLQ